MATQTLSELLGSTYPEDHPQTLSALLDADPNTITSDVARQLRSQVLLTVRRSEAHYVNGPWDVLNLATSGYVLHPWEGKWVTYALSADRQPVLRRDSEGVLRYLRARTPLLPKPDELPPLPQGTKRGSWLVLFGGTPSVLEKAGVVPGLKRLINKAPVSDITFFIPGSADGDAPTLWSARAGTGMRGTTPAAAREVPFPEPGAVSELTALLQGRTS